VIGFEQRLRELADDWAGITRAQIGQWENWLDELAREASEIKSLLMCLMINETGQHPPIATTAVVYDWELTPPL
jgi:hypothetical protein